MGFSSTCYIGIWVCHVKDLLYLISCSWELRSPDSWQGRCLVHSVYIWNAKCWFAVTKHHGRGNLEKQEFIRVYGSWGIRIICGGQAGQWAQTWHWEEDSSHILYYKRKTENKTEVAWTGGFDVEAHPQRHTPSSEAAPSTSPNIAIKWKPLSAYGRHSHQSHNTPWELRFWLPFVHLQDSIFFPPLGIFQCLH